MNKKFARVVAVLKDNYYATCRMVAENVGILKTIVHRILFDDLKNQKLCARFVLHAFTVEQQEQRTVHTKDLTIPVLSRFESARLFCIFEVENGVEGESIFNHKRHSNICNNSWRLFLLLIFREKCIGWKIAPTSVFQLMVITLNKKNLFRTFWNFFWWFSKHSLKTYGTHCVCNDLYGKFVFRKSISNYNSDRKANNFGHITLDLEADILLFKRSYLFW